MGDDHCWPGDARQNARNDGQHPEIDVLVPHKLNRPWHRLFDELDEVDENDTPLFKPIRWENVPASGVFEVDAAGSAGMLLRREVIETVEDPWFYSTMDGHGRQVVLNEDVTFCTRIRHEHGFRIFATADASSATSASSTSTDAQQGNAGGADGFSTMDDSSARVHARREACPAGYWALRSGASDALASCRRR
jgi:hypothetical protein